jgi:hypothetical protein
MNQEIAEPDDFQFCRARKSKIQHSLPNIDALPETVSIEKKMTSLNISNKTYAVKTPNGTPQKDLVEEKEHQWVKVRKTKTRDPNDIIDILIDALEGTVTGKENKKVKKILIPEKKNQNSSKVYFQQTLNFKPLLKSQSTDVKGDKLKVEKKDIVEERSYVMNYTLYH